MQTVERTITYYLADDGTLCRSEREANAHNQIMADHKTRKYFVKKEFRHPFAEILDTDWIFIRSERELEYFIRKYSSKGIQTLSGNLQIGDWVTEKYRYEEDFDYREKVVEELWTLNYMYEKLKPFMATVEELTVDGQY